MKTFLKGFCIGLFCLSLLGLLWFLVLQPGLTNGEAQALKTEYAQPLPGAESSGVLPAGKEQLEPESLVDLPALQAEYPDIKGWISIPGTCALSSRLWRHPRQRWIPTFQPLPLYGATWGNSSLTF